MSNTQSADLSPLRHTLSHLMAAAVLEHYPDAKLTLGPAVDNGFYYDIKFAEAPSENDLKKIEKTMKKLLPTWKEFSHREISKDEALELFKDNPFKTELVNEIAEKGETITLYTCGDFTDLCRGGHVEHPSKDIDSDSFSLSHIAGAYWRGKETNPMLTRIYGLAFESKEKLKEYMTLQEEAKKRDHRKLGQEQDLFFIDDMVGKGLVMWLPNGTIIRNEVERLAMEKEQEYGYIRVATPHIAKEELFLTSGHLPYYKDGMYPAMEMDDGVYYMRAMNCPHHHRIYLHKPHSYRELPIRIAEYGTVYRNELSGTLAGLLRVRGLAMNDAHIYCRKDQIKDEFKKVMTLVMEYFEIFGFKEYSFRLSKWDKNHTDKYINEPENWEYSEGVLREVLQEMHVPFVEVENEAAFYGPKVDVQFKSVLGREESLSTIQLDFLAKQRFGLSYVDETGKENNEVFVIHRAPLSTHERFLAILIEHYAGAFPTWLSPTQIRVLSISDKHAARAKQVADALKEAGIRALLDDSNETLGKKIRSWKVEKTPYAIVFGDKEAESGMLTLEARSGEKESLTLADLTEKLKKEILDRAS